MRALCKCQYKNYNKGQFKCSKVTDYFNIIFTQSLFCIIILLITNTNSTFISTLRKWITIFNLCSVFDGTHVMVGREIC